MIEPSKNRIVINFTMIIIVIIMLMQRCVLNNVNCYYYYLFSGCIIFPESLLTVLL